MQSALSGTKAAEWLFLISLPILSILLDIRMT